MSLKKNMLLILSLILFYSCNKSENESQATVYYNGDIVTMAGDSPDYVDALVEQNGKILFAGSSEEAMVVAGKGHQMIDLNGRTLLPGFIDGHCHFANFGAQAIGGQLLAPPDANVGDIPKLIEVMKKWNTPENRALTGWIFGTGFDDSVLKEKRFPTKQDLDQVSAEYPVMITHISGHFAVVNSKGLEQLGINADSKNPEGGIIRRENNSNEPNGVLEELAAIPYMLNAINPKSEESSLRFFEAGQDMALSYGYTTA